MIFGVESIDSIIAGGAIDFDSPFETWSIFDETSDMGVFEGAESNGDVTFSSKSIFAVESSFASVGATSAPMTSLFCNGLLFFKINIYVRIKFRECWGLYSPNLTTCAENFEDL